MCQYCNKTFFRLFSLQRHEQVHTGVKPCFCKECGKGFSEPRNLRQHMIRYHGEQGSIGEEDVQSIRRLRRPISSGLPRTSQRLAPVTPDMIQEAERLEKEAAMQKMGIHPGRSAAASPPPSSYDFTKLPPSLVGQQVLDRSRTYSGGSEPREPPNASSHLTSPSSVTSVTSSTAQLKVDTTSPMTSHPSSAFGPSPNPTSPHAGSSTTTLTLRALSQSNQAKGEVVGRCSGDNSKRCTARRNGAQRCDAAFGCIRRTLLDRAWWFRHRFHPKYGSHPFGASQIYHGL